LKVPFLFVFKELIGDRGSFLFFCLFPLRTFLSFFQVTFVPSDMMGFSLSHRILSSFEIPSPGLSHMVDLLFFDYLGALSFSFFALFVKQGPFCSLARFFLSLKIDFSTHAQCPRLFAPFSLGSRVFTGGA